MIIDVNKTNIQEVVVTGSANKTVLLYLFDPNASNLLALTSSLEKAVTSYDEYLTLAKGDASDPVIQSICYQLQIQALPAICAFSGGRPIDIVTADRLNDVSNIPNVISTYLPSKEQMLLAEATTLLENGNVHEAYLKIEDAFTINSNDINIRFTLIDVALKAHKVKRARELLDGVDPANQQTTTYKDLYSAVTLAEQNAVNPETEILEERLKSNPEDLENVEKLATAWSQNGEVTKALDMLYLYLKKDLNAGNIKKTYLDIIATINGDPIQPIYRRKLYTLLY